MSETKVIHINRAPEGWRENPDYVDISRNSKWGNPFVLGLNGSRREVVEKFKQAVLNGPLQWILEELEELRGKILVCYCKPAECHGDVYVELLNERE